MARYTSIWPAHIFFISSYKTLQGTPVQSVSSLIIAEAGATRQITSQECSSIFQIISSFLQISTEHLPTTSNCSFSLRNASLPSSQFHLNILYFTLLSFNSHLPLSKLQFLNHKHRYSNKIQQSSHSFRCWQLFPMLAALSSKSVNLKNFYSTLIFDRLFHLRHCHFQRLTRQRTSCDKSLRNVHSL